MADRPPVVAAWGAGVDSTAMIVELAERGEPIDMVLFADPGAEKSATYAFIPVFRAWMARTRHRLRDRPLPAPQLQTLAALCGHRREHADQRHPALRGIWWRVVRARNGRRPRRMPGPPSGNPRAAAGTQAARVVQADRLRRLGTRHAALPSRGRVRGSSLRLPLPLAGMGLVARRAAKRASRAPGSPSRPSRAATSAAASSPTRCWSFQPRSCASSC